MICPKCRAEYADSQSRCATDGASLCEREDLARIGQPIGPYVVEGVLGVGGMGVVYRARHGTLGKQVAIKVLSGRYRVRESAARDMLREARAASRLNHPNIININDYGTTDDGAAYIVMEYLVGEDLRALMAKGRLPVPRAVRILRQIASALAAAHRAGIVHRDLKPENVFLVKTEEPRVATPHDDEDIVKVLDFGLAKVLDMEPSARTREGVIAGTPHYMSPEHVRNRAIDGRSDVYSLGILFYQMVTGQLPFRGNSVAEVLMGHVSMPIIEPIQRNPTLDGHCNRTIVRCLEKDPAKRFATMEELLDALRRCALRPDTTGPHRLEDLLEPGVTRDVSSSAPVLPSGWNPPSRPDPSGPTPLVTFRSDTATPAMASRAVEESIPEVVGESVSGSAIFPSPWRGHRAWVVAGGAVTLAALVVVVAVVGLGRRAPVVAASAPKIATPTEGVPERVTVRLEGLPTGARVFLDGALRSERPLALRGSKAPHQLRVESDGLRFEQSLVADRDQTVRIVLAPAVAPASAPAPEKAAKVARKAHTLKNGKHAAKRAPAVSVKAAPAAAAPVAPQPAAKPAAQPKKYRDWVMDPD
jgi:serine/threonine-protein kinase